MMKEYKNKKGRIIIFFFIIIIIPAIWFFFLNKGSDHEIASKALAGDWLRADGPYTINISDVAKDGKMTTKYLNPNPIHVGTSSWSIQEGVLQIKVELQDVNYPGSTYELKFDEKANVLYGTYYQAVDKATYEVGFNKK